MLAEVVGPHIVVVVQAVQVGLEEALLAATQAQALPYQTGPPTQAVAAGAMVMTLLMLTQRVLAERA
tara:strand:+ start:291 stop:491 length:201 start_codon:yes stop_codon:yes gene_type:complete